MTGYALATALAAPVDDGMMWAEAVGGARGARDDRHRRVVVLGVDADDDRGRVG